MASNSDRRTLLEAHAALEGHPAFKVIVEHMRKARAVCAADLTQATDPVLIYRAQGAAATLDAFLTDAEDAREIIGEHMAKANARTPGAW